LGFLLWSVGLERFKQIIHGDVGVVRGVERKALGVHLEQTVVGGLRVLEHRGVRQEEDVDGRDRVWRGRAVRSLGGSILPVQGEGIGHRSFEQGVSEVLGG
jgi:hypothetical protein